MKDTNNQMRAEHAGTPLNTDGGEEYMFPWQEDYKPNLFINRPNVLNEIRAWANASSVAKRVWSLVAPPGSGKTWILKKLYDEWSEPQSNRFVVWMDVPRLVNRAEEQNADLMINSAAFTNWFTEIQTKARKYCLALRPIPPIIDFSAMISKLVEILCDCNLDRAPIVIVDGYDEISKKQAQVISNRLLDRFIERECVRMVMAYRDDWSVMGNTLRNMKQKQESLNELDPLTKDFAIRQFESLYRNKYSTANLPDPTTWMRQLKHYKWNHPFINAFLINRALRNATSKLRQLDNQDFYDCCQAVIQRPDSTGKPRYPMLTPAAFDLLHNIANQLDDEWGQTELEETLRISALDKRLDPLFAAGLIHPLPNGKSIYQIGDGLRELLRELNLANIQKGDLSHE